MLFTSVVGFKVQAPNADRALVAMFGIALPLEAQNQSANGSIVD